MPWRCSAYLPVARRRWRRLAFPTKGTCTVISSAIPADIRREASTAARSTTGRSIARRPSHRRAILARTGSVWVANVTPQGRRPSCSETAVDRSSHVSGRDKRGQARNGLKDTAFRERTPHLRCRQARRRMQQGRSSVRATCADPRKQASDCHSGNRTEP